MAGEAAQARRAHGALAVPLSVLFGSQSGSAAEVAHGLASGAQRRGFAPVRCDALDAYDLGALAGERVVLFVVATTGDGDPPDNMRQFWRFLLRKDLPADVLRDVAFAVFGLGDSSYAKYNVVARKLRNRLLMLGARELAPLGLGDDQSALGCEADLDRWRDSELWPQLLAHFPPPPGWVLVDAPQALVPRNSSVGYMEAGAADAVAAPSAVAASIASAALSPAPSAEAEAAFDSVLRALRPAGCYETPPVWCEVVSNQRITSSEWEQDVRHVELRGAVPPYEAGDVAVLYPRNVAPEERWERLRELCGAPSLASVCQLGGFAHLPARCSVRELFERYLDLLGTPRRSFFEQLSFWASDEGEREKLLELGGATQGSDFYHQYCKKERKTYLEVLLDDFGSCRPPLHVLAELVPRLEPRLYSIASARGAQGADRVQLCVALLAFTTPWGRRKRGVASQWLAELRPPQRVALFIKRGALREPPSRAAPLVLVGPGTGVAPMRALAHQRRSDNTHLYFGCRSRDKDFYYAHEWPALQREGALGRLRVAFSRDQPAKVYVQNLLAEDADLLYAWLVEQGGFLYISGSAKRMPQEVRQAIQDAFASRLARDGADDAPALAADIVRRMELRGNIRIEAWS